MAKQTRREIYITCNGKSADDMLRTLTDHAAKLDAQIEKLRASGKGSTKECKELVSVSGQLHKQLKQNISSTEMIDKVMKNLAGSTTAQLRKALQAVRHEMSLSSEASGKLPQLRKQMEALKAQIDKNTGAIHNQSGAWNTAMKNLTAYVGLFSLFNKAKELVTGAIKKNFEYSGSLTDIRKVSGLTMDQVKQLSTELAKIDTRTSVDGLAQLAYQGAKLGMSKYGVEGMTQFVKAADKINVALGEELGEEALPALSKMVEVMGLIPKMGIEKAMDATGSAMFKLSTTSTATSNDIVEFSKRLTGVARTAGITTDQLLALGSASSSMMLMPEVSSTALGKFIVALQKNHNLIAKELGIPDETIKNLYASGHAMDAIVLVLEKMRDKGNMNALGGIFKDLGSDGQRLVTAMVTMSKNVDMLKDHLYESEEAFREATAVTNEYEMQQQSAIGILERANNLWEKAFVNPDGVDAVKGMAEWWYEMSQMMTSSPLLKGTLQVALQMVLLALKAVATLLPVIIGYMASQGIYSGIMLIKNYGLALWSAVKQMYAYVTATRTATAAQTGLNSAMKLNPWVALASVIVAVAGAVYGYTQQAKEAAKAEMEAQRQANAWKDTLGQAAVETANLNKKLENYKRMMNESNLSQKERQGLISRFNKDFRSYISNLGIEIKSVKDLRDHYSELAQEAQRATYYRMMEKAKQQALPKLDADRDTAANELIKQLKNANLDLFGVTFQDIDRWVSKGANGNAIYKYMVSKLPVQQTGMFSGLRYNIDENGRLYTTNKAGRRAYADYQNLDLLSASRWYANATGRRRKKEKEIEDNYHKWFSEDYTPYPEETPGTLENNAPEKGTTTGSRGGKTGSGGNPNNTEKNVAKDRANALIANIKAFYEEQMRKYLEWVAQMNADGEKISEGQQKEQMDYLQSQMERALGKARQSIATLDNGWKKFFQYMDEDVMVYDDETSKQLLESIGKADVSELHKLFYKLSGDLSRENNKTLAENLGALLDQIFANGSKELREAAEKLLARQREIQKILNEHDYTGAVNRNTRSEFDRLGFLQPAKDIRADSPEGLDKMNAAFDKLTTKARESITVLYSLNPESRDFKSQFLDFLSVANEGFDFSELKAQNLKALYLE
ncbi:MAG: phage tail tape measure protein, partial [Prevotella sp.]|nr:phage tail tape measure protein [Prevotella sp.]